MRSSGPMPLRVHGLDLAVGGAHHLVVRQGGAVLVLLEVRDRGVEREVALEEEAVGLALLGDEGEAVIHGIAGVAEVHEVVTEIHTAGSAGANAEDGLKQLGAAGAHQAVQTEDLAAAHVEGDVLQVRVELRGQVLNLQNGLAGTLSTGGKRLSSERPTMAEMSSFMFVSLVDFVITRLPVAQHRDLIADLEDLIHLVRDVDEGDALLAKLAHHLEELLHLLLHNATKWAHQER